MKVPLYPYQEPAVDKLIERGNFLLAFDMGLGKTITAIAAAEELLGLGKIDQVLVLCPAGLKWQWAAAIAKFTDVATEEIKAGEDYLIVPEERYCIVVDGGPEKRRRAYEKISSLNPQYVIAGYQTVVTDRAQFLRMRPGLIIADEMTVIKNPAARVTRAVRRLKAPYKLGLTGTPIENRLEELFQLYRWLDADLLGSEVAFDRAYIIRDYWGNVKGYRNTHVLHKKVAPAMLRLRADDPQVAPYMPKLERERWTVRMDDATAAVYRRIMADLAAELEQLPRREQFDVLSHYNGDRPDERTPAGRVMAVHLAAQQLLTHPPLLESSPSRYARTLVDSGVLTGLPESAKILKLRAEIDRILRDDPAAKVIIVTRFRGLLTYLETLFTGHVVYHGGMNAASRQAAVNAFQTNPDLRLFLMSHAGAYGVDLPVANWLINVDPARSAGQRAQIDARHVRASSAHQRVNVVDLVTAGTIEERTYDRLDLRGRVARAVVDGADGGMITDEVGSLTEHIRQVLAA